MELSGQAERGNGGAERLSQYEGDSGDNGGGDCECAAGHGSHWRDALRGVGAWARNPQAGENQILHGIAEIDVLEERKRQAEEFMAWFQPAWDALGEDEKTVLTMFYLSENGKTDAIEEISERFCVERSSAYKKKDRALAHLALLLYGR